MTTFTLYLTPEERALFDALPAALRENFHAQEESRVFNDTPLELRARQALAKFENSALRSMHDDASKRTPEAVFALLQNPNINDLPPHDQRELLFVVGPHILGMYIIELVRAVKTVDDLAQIADVTRVRAVLFDAFLPVHP